MKKFYIVVLLIVLTVTSNLQAQDESNSPLSVGARVGVVVSDFSNGQPHTSSIMGYTVGGIVEYSFSPLFSLQTEPAYFLQGGEFVRFSDDSRFGLSSSVSSLYTTENSIKVHGIDLPLFAKLSINVADGFDPHLMLGGSATYNFFAENNFDRTYYYNQTFSTINGYEEVTSEYETFNFSLVGGVGSSFKVANKELSIDFRYRYGITPVKKSYSYVDLFAVQEDLYSNSFYLTIGVQF